MFILLILSLVVLTAGIWRLAYNNRSDLGAFLVFISIIGLMMFAFTSSKFQIGNETLTGYIYRRTDSFGAVSYDIRYSLNAGSDGQPSFCVRNGSDTDNRLKTLVGSKSKIEVHIPSNGLFFANNPFECSSEAQLVKVETIKETK